MFNNRFLSFIFLPISLLYGWIVSLRNIFYQKGILKRTQFDIPIICIGNLSVGGAGKTPHTEYLIRLLNPYINISTLSRGYKRKTTGFIEVQVDNLAEDVGDEPLQLKRKHPDAIITVGENRVNAVTKIMASHPETQTILLDDAYQHLAIKAGLYIMLTEFKYPFFEDWIMPSGRLREWKEGYERSDIIIVTKCPKDEKQVDKEYFYKKIKLLPHQKVFFTYLNYLNPYYIFNGNQRFQLASDIDIILICGIAKPEYLIKYLESTAGKVHVMEFDDHQDFKNFHLAQLLTAYKTFESNKKVIITTEKDAIRLQQHRDFLIKNQLPIFALPIEVFFHFDEKVTFNNYIKNYLLNFQV